MFKRSKISFDHFVGFTAALAFALLLFENSVYLKPYSLIAGEINLSIGLVFILDLLLRFFSSPDKKKYLRQNWFQLIVVVPFLQLVLGMENTPFFVISRLAAIVIMAFFRVRKPARLFDLLSLKPSQLMLVTFGLVIGIGAVLLMLPASARAGSRTAWIDALFTATSAVCVTGLTVKDTGTHFSLFGQTVILGLIQAGGLGIMTFSVSLALMLGKRLNMKQEALMTDVLDQSALSQVRNLVVYIFKMTFFFELFGAMLLFLAWAGKTGGLLRTMYQAVFHSVSAFCNAGFSTFSDNLTGFREDISTNAVICGLIVLGGLGFTVIKDLQESLRSRLTFSARRKTGLRVQTRIVLWTSAALIILGAGAIYFLERNALFGDLSLKGQILSSFFQSITSRTAGFNSCDIGRLSLASLSVIMGLMFIGGSPGSTAGGVKTTTFSILLTALAGEFKAKKNTEIFKRTIPEEVIRKAGIMFFFSAILVFLFFSALLFTEKKAFSDVLFETVSAFGTVGLSAGLTPALSLKGKLLISVLMFIGRLGPLTVGYAFLRLHPHPKCEYASESVAVG